MSHIVGSSPSISSTAHTHIRTTVSRLKCHPSGSTHTLTSHHSHAVNLVTNNLGFFNLVSAVASVRSVTHRRKLFVDIVVIRRTLYARSSFSGLYSAFGRRGISTFVFLAPASIVFTTTYHTHIGRPHIVIASARNRVAIHRKVDLVSARGGHHATVINVSR